MDTANGKATFVIPHYLSDSESGRAYFDETLKAIFSQTDGNWQIIIIDDCSPGTAAKEYLKELASKYPESIHVIFNSTNMGPGFCRNTGIRWAYENNSPIILFNDADDVSHPRRLEYVRKILNDDAEADVVYSGIQVINEKSIPVCKSELTQSMQEILESLEGNPPQGENFWIDIATDKGYTNLTSSTAVRTALAHKYPFPPEKVSEDYHTWMRYSAGGGKVVYCHEIPTLYRIPSNTEGSSSRSREGGRHMFYLKKAEVDTAGFMEALDIAVGKSAISENERDGLLIKFLIRLALTMARENEFGIANAQIAKAIEISEQKAKAVIGESGLKNYKQFKI